MLLNVDTGLVFWTILTFIGLVWVLRKFAWKPLMDVLHNREEMIRKAIERAETAQADADQLLQENQKQLKQAEQEGHRILAESRTLAEKLKDGIVQKANQQSRKMIEQARGEIERDRDAALVQLRGEVANLAITTAEKILDETLDENRHRRIIESYLHDLPEKN